MKNSEAVLEIGRINDLEASVFEKIFEDTGPALEEVRKLQKEKASICTEVIAKSGLAAFKNEHASDFLKTALTQGDSETQEAILKCFGVPHAYFKKVAFQENIPLYSNKKLMAKQDIFFFSILLPQEKADVMMMRHTAHVIDEICCSLCQGSISTLVSVGKEGSSTAKTIFIQGRQHPAASASSVTVFYKTILEVSNM